MVRYILRDPMYIILFLCILSRATSLVVPPVSSEFIIRHFELFAAYNLTSYNKSYPLSRWICRNHYRGHRDCCNRTTAVRLDFSRLAHVGRRAGMKRSCGIYILAAAVDCTLVARNFITDAPVTLSASIWLCVN